MTPDDALLCPRCQLPAALGDTCPRCDVPLVARATLPPWGLAGRLEMWPAVTPIGALRYALTGLFLLGCAAAFVVLELNSSPTSTFPGAALAVVWTALFSLGAVADVLQGRRLIAQRREALAALRRADADAQDVTASPASATPGARVRVEGVVRVERATVSPEGARCAAWQGAERASDVPAEGSVQGPGFTFRTRGGTTVRLSLFDGTESRAARGGVFTLELASGERVRVSAEHVALAEDGVVSDGDRVSVSGDARLTTPENAASHHRAEAKVLELVGTSTQPVYLRKSTARASAAATGVRVAVTESHEAAAAERIEGDDAAAQGRSHGRPRSP